MDPLTAPTIERLPFWHPGDWGERRKDGWEARARIGGQEFVLHLDRGPGSDDRYTWGVRPWNGLEAYTGVVEGRRAAMLEAGRAIGIEPTSQVGAAPGARLDNDRPMADPWDMQMGLPAFDSRRR
jgi:hypothetical protein